jgi:hypothetical protein
VRVKKILKTNALKIMWKDKRESLNEKTAGALR